MLTMLGGYLTLVDPLRWVERIEDIDLLPSEFSWFSRDEHFIFIILEYPFL